MILHKEIALEQLDMWFDDDDGVNNAAEGIQCTSNKAPLTLAGVDAISQEPPLPAADPIPPPPPLASTVAGPLESTTPVSQQQEIDQVVTESASPMRMENDFFVFILTRYLGSQPPLTPRPVVSQDDNKHRVQGQLVYADPTKPLGEACNDDGTLKDAKDMVWLNSPSDEKTKGMLFSE